MADMEDEITKQGHVAVCPECNGPARYHKDEGGLLLLCSRDTKNHNFRLIQLADFQRP